MTQVIPKKSWMRPIALIVAALFIWETAAWATPAPLHDVLSKSYTVQRDGIQIPNQVQIPSSLGKITEAFRAVRSTNDTVLVHIEDAHGEPEAQKNSQAILEHLKKEYGIQTFFLEGAWSKLDPALLRFSKNAEENQKILSELTEKGIVGGPENFLYGNSRYSVQGTAYSDEVAGYGIEDLELYKKNLEQFRVVISAKAASDIFLNEMKAGLLTKASQVLNPELAEHFRQWSFQEEVRADYAAHLRALAEQAQKHLGLDLNDAREQYDWPMLVRFQKLKLLESYSVQSTAYSEEKKRFQGWLQNKNLISAKQINLILSDETRIANYDLRSFFENFYGKAAPLGFKFKDYPVLSKAWGRQMLAQELDAPTLVKEVETLENKLIEKLAQTADEKKIIEKYREYLLLKKLLHLELSKEEFQIVQRTAYNVQRGETLKTAIAFYQTAELRDTAMFARTVDWIKKEGIEKAAIITGGFHSRGLGELLRQKDISYVRIQPRITNIYGRENYLKWTLGEKSSLRAVSPAEPDALPVFRNALTAQVAAIAPQVAETSSQRSEARKVAVGRSGFEMIHSDEIAVTKHGLEEIFKADRGKLAKAMNEEIDQAADGKKEIVFKGVRFFRRQSGSSAVWAFKDSEPGKVRENFKIILAPDPQKEIGVSLKGLQEMLGQRNWSKRVFELNAWLDEHAGGANEQTIEHNGQKIRFFRRIGMNIAPWHLERKDLENFKKMFVLFGEIQTGEITIAGQAFQREFRTADKDVKVILAELDKAEYEQQLSVKWRGITFHRRYSGHLPVWVVLPADRAAFVREFKIDDRGNIDDIQVGEYALSDNGLRAAFDTAPSDKETYRAVMEALEKKANETKPPAREVEYHGIVFRKRFSRVHQVWAFAETDKEKVRKLIGLYKEIEPDEIAVSLPGLTPYTAAPMVLLDWLKGQLPDFDSYTEEEVVFEEIIFFKRRNGPASVWVFKGAELYKVLGAKNRTIGKAITLRKPTSSGPITEKPGDEKLIYLRRGPLRQALGHINFDLETMVDELDRLRGQDKSEVVLNGLHYQWMNFGQNAYWAFAAADLERFAELRNFPTRIKPDETSITRNNGNMKKMEEVIAALDKAAQGKAKLEHKGIVYRRRISGTNVVWAYPSVQKQAFQKEWNWVDFNALPVLTAVDAVITGPALKLLYPGDRSRENKRIGAELEAAADGRDAFEYKGILITQKRSGKEYFWTFPLKDKDKFAQVFKVALQIQSDEIPMIGGKLQDYFLGRRLEVAQHLNAELNKLDPQGELMEVEYKGIRFYKRLSAKTTGWVAKKHDMLRIMALYPQKRPPRRPVQIDPKKILADKVETVMAGLVGQDLHSLALRYGREFEEMVWQIVGPENLADRDMLREVFDEFLIAQLNQAAPVGSTAIPMMSGAVPADDAKQAKDLPVSEAPRRMDATLSADEINDLAGRFESALGGASAQAAVQSLARQQAVNVIKALEEQYFFKKYYRDHEGDYQGDLARQEIEKILRKEKNALTRDALKAFLEEVKAAVKFDAELHRKGLKANSHLDLYQGIASLRMLRERNMILADQMGVGKTMQAIATFLASGEKEMAVFGPKMILSRWVEDLVVHTDVPLEIVAIVGKDKVREFQEILAAIPGAESRIKLKIFDNGDGYDYLLNARAAPPTGTKRVLLMNYQRLPNLLQRKQASGSAAAIEVPFLVLDEFQLLKRSGTQSAEAIFGNGNGVPGVNAKWKLLLSGTPLENQISDLFAGLNFLAAQEDGAEAEWLSKMRRQDFAQFFSTQELGRLAQLHGYLKRKMIRRLKEDVLSGLPEKIYRKVVLNPWSGVMTEEGKGGKASETKLPGSYAAQRELYESYLLYPSETEAALRALRRNENGAEDDEEAAESTAAKTTQIMRMEQATLDPLQLGVSADSIKFDAASQLLNARVREEQKSCLVVTNFRGSAKAFHKYLLSQGYNGNEVGFIAGGVDADERRTIMQAFQSGKIKILVATTAAVELGIELTRADAILFLNHPWKPSTREQVIDRAHRRDPARNYPGRKLEIISLEVDLPVSIDLLKLQVLRRKEILSQMVIDGQLAPEILKAFKTLDDVVMRSIEQAANPVLLDEYEKTIQQQFLQMLGQALAAADPAVQASIWDEMAALYLEILEHKGSFFANMASLEFLSERFPDLARGGIVRALDLASGPSTLKRAYERNRPGLAGKNFSVEVTDYDLSRNMLALGKRGGLQIQGALDDLEKAVGEANLLKPESFELVNLSYGMSYVRHPAKLVEQVNRLLVPQGLFVLILPPQTQIPGAFFTGLEKAGFEIQTRPDEGLQSRLADVEFADLVREYGAEFAQDAAREVKTKVRYIVARKKGAATLPVQDSDFKLERQKKYPIDSGKIKKLVPESGGNAFLPAEMMVDGHLVDLGKVPGGVESEEARALSKIRIALARVQNIQAPDQVVAALDKMNLEFDAQERFFTAESQTVAVQWLERLWQNTRHREGILGPSYGTSIQDRIKKLSARSEARTDENKEEAYFRRDNFELIRKGDMARLVKAAEQSNRIKIRLVGVKGRPLFDDLEYLLLDPANAEELSAGPIKRKWRTAYLQNEDTGEIFPTSFSMLESGNWTYRDFSRSESRVFGMRFDDPRHPQLFHLVTFAFSLDLLISVVLRPLLRAYLPEWYPALFNWLPDFLVPLSMGLMYGVQAHLFSSEEIKQTNVVFRMFKFVEMKPVLWLLEKLKVEGIERARRVAFYQPLYIAGLLAFAEIFFPFVHKYFGFTPFGFLPATYHYGIIYDHMDLLFNVFAAIALFFLNRVGTWRETVQMVKGDVKAIFSFSEKDEAPSSEEITNRSELRRDLAPQEIYDLLKTMTSLFDDDLIRAEDAAQKIAQLPVQKVLVVGTGLKFLPDFLYLMGKEVVFVDASPLQLRDRAVLRALRARYFEKKGVASPNYPEILSEIGELDLQKNGLEPNSFDLVTMADLSMVPVGDPLQWLLKAKELLRKDQAYLLGDMQDLRYHGMTPAIGQNISTVFPNRRVLFDGEYFRGDYDGFSSRNQFFEVQNNRSEARPRDSRFAPVSQPGSKLARTEVLSPKMLLNESLNELGVSETNQDDWLNRRNFIELGGGMSPLANQVRQIPGRDPKKKIYHMDVLAQGEGAVRQLFQDPWPTELDGKADVIFSSRALDTNIMLFYRPQWPVPEKGYFRWHEIIAERMAKALSSNGIIIVLTNNNQGEAIYRGLKEAGLHVWWGEGLKNKVFAAKTPRDQWVATNRSEARTAPKFKNLVGNGKGLGFLPFLRTWEFFYRSFKVWTLFRSKSWPIVIEGYENLWTKDRLILAGNHTGMAENAFFVTELYRLAGRMPFFIAQPDHVDAFTRLLLDLGGGLRIEKGKTVGKAKEFLKDNPGAMLGVFPAGRPERIHEKIKTSVTAQKSTEEIAHDFLHWQESAVAKIAIETGVAVVPFAIDSNVPRKWGLKELWHAFRQWEKAGASQPPFYIKVRIGKPIPSQGKSEAELLDNLKNSVVANLKVLAINPRENPKPLFEDYLHRFSALLAKQPDLTKWSDHDILEFFHENMPAGLKGFPGWAGNLLRMILEEGVWTSTLSADQAKLLAMYVNYLKFEYGEGSIADHPFTMPRREFVQMLTGLFGAMTTAGLEGLPGVVVRKVSGLSQKVLDDLPSLVKSLGAERSALISLGHSTVFKWATAHLGLDAAFRNWGVKNKGLLAELWNYAGERVLHHPDGTVEQPLSEQESFRQNVLFNSWLKDILLGKTEQSLPEDLRGKADLVKDIYASAGSLLGLFNRGVDIFNKLSPQAKRGITLYLGKQKKTGGSLNDERYFESEIERIAQRRQFAEEKLWRAWFERNPRFQIAAQHVETVSNPDPALVQYLDAEWRKARKTIDQQLAGELRDLEDQQKSTRVARRIIQQVQPYMLSFQQRTLFTGRSEMRGGLTRRAWLTMAAGFIGASAAAAKAQEPVSAVKAQLFKPAEVDAETLELKKFIGSEIDALLSEWALSQDKEQQKRAEFIKSILPTTRKSLWFYSPKNSGMIATSGAVRLRFGNNRLHEIDPETGKPAFELLFSYDFAKAIQELVLNGNADAKDFARNALLGGIFMKEMMTLKPMIEHPEYFEILAAAQMRFNNPVSAKLKEDGKIEMAPEKLSKEERDFLITTIAYFDLLLEAEGYVGELDYLSAAYPPEKFIGTQKKMMQLLQDPEKAEGAWSSHFREKGAEAIFGFLKSRTHRFVEDKKFIEKWNAASHSQKIKWEAFRHILAVQQGKGASMGVTVSQWLVYDAFMRRQMDVAWDKKMDFLGKTPEELGLPKSVEALNIKLNQFHARSEVRDEVINPYLSASLQLLEEGDRKMALSAGQTKRFKNPRNIFVKRHEFKLGGESKSFVASRVRHFHPQDESGKDLPVRGGLRVLMPSMLGKVFDEKLSALPFTGDDEYDLYLRKQFLERWIQEYAHAMAIQMTLKNLLWGLPRGGAKGVIFLGEWKKVSGEWQLVPTIEKKDDLNSISRIFREVSKIFLVNNVIHESVDGAAPDVNPFTGIVETDRMMEWMVDSTIRVLAQSDKVEILDVKTGKVNKAASSELQLQLEAIAELDITQTPYLERAILFLQKHPELAWPVLGRYTGKSVLRAGSQYRTESTGEAAVVIAREMLRHEIKISENENPLRGKTAAVQGFGAVGIQSVLRLIREGAQVMLLSDHGGAIQSKNKSGFTLEEVTEMVDLVRRKQSIIQFAALHPESAGVLQREAAGEDSAKLRDLGNAELLQSGVELLFLAALNGQIHPKNADLIRAGYVVDIANGGITPDAAAQLAQKNILVVPSILASGGGTAISHQEVLQNQSNHYFEMSFVRENLESDIRDFMRAIYQVIEMERAQGRKLDLNEAAYVVARQKTLAPLKTQPTRSEMRIFNGYDGVADEVVKVAREKQARKKGTGVLLGLGGPSGVGKGFFSKIISGALTQQGYDVHSLEIDGFLKLDAEEVKLQQRAAAQGKIHDTEWDFWDEEEAFDVLWMVHDFLNMSFEPPTHPLLLDKIKAAGNPDNIDVIEIVIPQAWHRTQKDGSNRYEDKWVLHRDSVVILDGKYIARFEKKFREVKSKRLSDALLVLEDDSDATREKYVHRVYEKYAHQLRSASYLLDEKLNIFDNALVPSYQRYENETRDVWDYLINVRGLYRPEISEDYPQPIVFESQDVINPKKLDESVAADLRIFSDFVLGYYPEHYQRVKKALNEKRLLAMVGYEKLPTAAQVMGEILAELHMAMRDHSANPRKLQTLFQFNTPTAINFPDLKAAMSVYLEGRAMPVRELERILDNKDDEQRGKMDRNLTYQLLIAPKLMQYLMYLAQSTKELKTFAHYRDRAVNAWSNLEREALAALKADGFEMSGDFVGLAYKEKLIQNAMNIILGNYSSVQYQDGESAARSEIRMPKAGRDSLAALRFFYREVLRLHLDMTRASYRSTEEDERKQAVYDEVAVDLKELQRLLQGHPQLRRQLASRIKSAVSMLAERGTKRNPVAAGTALTQAVEDILNKLYEPRVKKQGRRHRDSLAARKIVHLKNGMWILKQGVYRNVKVGKRGSVAMTQKQDKQFSSLWELARSLDHQLEKMTSELTRARETLVVLNDIQDFLEHSAGELPPDLSARLGKTLKTMQAQWVIEKQLAAQALQFAVELEHQEVRSRVARFAEYASWLIKMRADELEGMIASVQRLREKDLNSEVSSRNYNFARSLRSLRSMLERYFGTTGVTWRSAREPRPVQAKVAGIIRDLEQVREPDYEGILALLRGIQSGFGQSLKVSSPETESRLLRYVEVALGLVKFSDVRHNALFEFEKRKREIGSKSEEMDEDAIFQTVFQDLINQRKLNDRTQWPSAWFDLYAFAREPIHLTVQKERVPNPRFEALRVLSQILGAKSLQDALNRKKVKAVPGLVAKIKELSGSDLNQSVFTLPGEARKQLFEFIQTTFQLEKKLPLLPAQYRVRSEIRRPDPWEATGLWAAADLKQKIQEAKQPGQYVNQYRLSASLKALSESDWKDLEAWAGKEDSIDLAALNRMKHNDAKYSPVLELGEDLIEQRREMPLFFGMARMVRQSWTDKNEALWMEVLKIGFKYQFKAHGTLNSGVKEFGSLVANLGVLQLHAAMLGIMIDGKISRGDLGEFGFSKYDDFAPLNAADYGPYYVLIHPNYRKADFEYRGGWHDTDEEAVSSDDHLIYLIPEESARPYFIEGLKKSVKYGFMSEGDAIIAEAKIMTYEEFIAVDENMKEILSKEKTPVEVIQLATRSEPHAEPQDENRGPRSEARAGDSLSIANTVRATIAEATQNIFAVEFVASMSRAEFRSFFDRVFPSLVIDRQKRLRDSALSKAGVTLSINEGLIVGSDLAETEGFWEAAKILFNGQKIAILGEGKSPLDNVRFFKDVPSAKQWVNAKKIVAWVSPEEALEHAELRKEVFDWVIMNEQRLAKLYSALGLEAFAQKLMISREFLRAA